MREFLVIAEDRDVKLSIKRMEQELAWKRLRQLMEEDVTFKVSGERRWGW